MRRSVRRSIAMLPGVATHTPDRDSHPDRRAIGRRGPTTGRRDASSRLVDTAAIVPVSSAPRCGVPPHAPSPRRRGEGQG